jgi:hypothetical protein
MAVNLSSQVTRYGVSESFNGLIEGLRDTHGLAEKKFRLDDVNKVAQYLVCRNYGKACLELCYLSWAIVNYPTKTIANTSLLEFFWIDENITPARFRQAFSQQYQSKEFKISLNEDNLQLHFSQQLSTTNSFSISPTRVGVLAVLLEVITTIDPQQLQYIEESLKNTSNDKAIKALSSELQKVIYQYLAEHLIQAQQQRRFRYITQWLDNKKENQNSGHRASGADFLNDETILEFWQQACSDDTSPGFKLYSSALNDFINTHQALQQAKQVMAVENAATIGLDVERGEFSPDAIQELLFIDTTETEDFSWLCQTPKFLTKSQWTFIEPLLQHRAQSKTLALSFVRLAVFGQWQATLVQAKRKSSQTLKQKLNVLPAQNYQQYQQQLSDQKNAYTSVILAIIHILYTHQDSRYLGGTLDFLPVSVTKKIKSLVQNQLQNEVALDAETINKLLFNLSQALLLQSLEFQQLMQSAKKAFNSNHKEGFQRIPVAEQLDKYQDGYDALSSCQQLICAIIKQLENIWSLPSDCETNFCSDVSIFKSMFEQIYGDTHE